MSNSGRGSSRAGRPARLPGVYAPARLEALANSGGHRVDFYGDDGRHHVYDFAELPMLGWHEALARAFAWRTGPSGGLATRESASSCWRSVVRWMRFLHTLDRPPASPAELSAADVDAFYQREGFSAHTRSHDLQILRRLFNNAAMRAHLPDDTWSAFQLRTRKSETGVAGYSDGELARLLGTLRAQTVRIRNQIHRGEDLLRRYRHDPRRFSSSERELGALLTRMAESGEVPAAPRATASGSWLAYRKDLASHLFLTLEDLPALMLLMAALSHRNGETIKELPAQHRLVEGRVVEVDIVKRRHGRNRWYETVTWEIGPPSRQLHTPGGMYQLLLELTERSRVWCSSPLAICVWRNGHSAGVRGSDEHYAPFSAHLKGATLRLAEWASRLEEPLLADAPEVGGSAAARLPVTFNRIKTSMDVRRTKQLGGHLPSAARSNTMQVLFRHYLSGDPIITNWAQQVLGEALADAEQAALQAHRAALDTAGAALHVIPGPTDTGALAEVGLDPALARKAAAGELDTAWSGCVDHVHHPATGQQCQASFLDCFHCGNCLVTRDHLPRLLGLLDALNARREQMSNDDWWKRYGPAWAAIRRDILAKFSSAERREAEQTKPTDVLLELVENP